MLLVVQLSSGQPKFLQVNVKGRKRLAFPGASHLFFEEGPMDQARIS